ncbi:hypothetical protein UPYG_G00243260 [Umbra pygmaea]|uniref:NF-X1-type domain-containing protein n=1 Tax=Umbra pygmaea TaxID=75934 RepID=A0ABD0WY17_UMBPY
MVTKAKSAAETLTAAPGAVGGGVSALPCPPCLVPIPTACLGEHEVSPVPCHRKGPFSCKRLCGRTLTCGNHSCRKECHYVTATTKLQVGPECEVCEEGCVKPRPMDCPHPCALPCHPGSCPPCQQMIRQRCHCKISLMYIDCLKFSSCSDPEKSVLGSCQNQCPKQLGCGHRCKDLCHPGRCEEKCSHKVKLRCPCKRIKKELPCSNAREDQLQVECDEACVALRKKAYQEKQAEEKAALEEEARKQQAELEAFEKRQKGRRKKRGRRGEEDQEEPGVWRRFRLVLIVPLCGALLAAAAFYLTHLG